MSGWGRPSHAISGARSAGCPGRAAGASLSLLCRMTCAGRRPEHRLRPPRPPCSALRGDHVLRPRPDPRRPRRSAPAPRATHPAGAGREPRDRARRPARPPGAVVAGADHRADLRGAARRGGARTFARVPRPGALPGRGGAGPPGLRRRHFRHRGPRRAHRGLPPRLPGRGGPHRLPRRARLGPPLSGHARGDAARQRRHLRGRPRLARALRRAGPAPGGGALPVHSRRPLQGDARRARLSRGVAAGDGRPEHAEQDRPLTVQTIAVLGAGIMGRGIAYASALGGYRTVLQDTSDGAIEQALAEITALLEKGAATGKVPEAEAVAARRRLATARTLEEAAREADLVIEAAP